MHAIEIFRAGTRQDANGNLVTISVDDLRTIAANYKPEFHEAPIVIGHPKHDNPAYGWIKGLTVDGDVLKAETQQVDSQFAEMVRNGRYKKVSASFYLPHSSANPKPEGFYLRHVGFLGAAPPAVKGMQDPVFNDSENDFVEFSDWTQATLWQRLRDFFISKFGLEAADNVIPAWQVQSLTEEATRESIHEINAAAAVPAFSEPANAPEPTDSHLPDEKPQGEVDMSETEKQRLAELEAENARLKAEQANAMKAQREAENAEFAESLVAAGKLTPKQKTEALALLNADHASADFSETGFSDRLKAFLSQLPKVVEFTEVATKEAVANAQDKSVEYAEGTDPASIEVDKKIQAYMQAHGVSYSEAFTQLFN